MVDPGDPKTDASGLVESTEMGVEDLRVGADKTISMRGLDHDMA